MLYLLIALQLADIATTHYALRQKIGVEANPLLRTLFDKFGHEVVLLVTKGVFVAFLVYFYEYIYVEALYLVAALYCYVIYNNLKVILGKK